MKGEEFCRSTGEFFISLCDYVLNRVVSKASFTEKNLETQYNKIQISNREVQAFRMAAPPHKMKKVLPKKSGVNLTEINCRIFTDSGPRNVEKTTSCAS